MDCGNRLSKLSGESRFGLDLEVGKNLRRCHGEEFTPNRKVSQALLYGPSLPRRPKIFVMGIGKRIRALRKTAGLAQGKLAQLAKMPQSTLSSLEHGDSLVPRGDHLARIASVLKVSHEWLLTGQGSPVASMQPAIDEAELLMVYRELTDASKAALIASAHAMRGSQPNPSAASPLKRPTSKQKT